MAGISKCSLWRLGGSRYVLYTGPLDQIPLARRLRVPELSPPWLEDSWVRLTRLLLASYRNWLATELVDRAGTLPEQAERLFEAPFVVVAHETQPDPVLCYANRTALRLWETDLPALLQMPSRLTAEPMHRDERALLLERTTRNGYVDDYRGVRISSTGRRFEIEQAIVWNLVDESNVYRGQAATFSNWKYL